MRMRKRLRDLIVPPGMVLIRDDVPRRGPRRDT